VSVIDEVEIAVVFGSITLVTILCCHVQIKVQGREINLWKNKG